MMAPNNSFLESLKVDAETKTKIAEVSKNYHNSPKSNVSKKSADNGGRERGDEGPGTLGRESGFKKGGEKLGNCYRAISSYKGKAKGSSIKEGSHHSSIVSSSAKTLATSAKAGHSANSYGEASTGGHSGNASSGHAATGGSLGGSGGGYGSTGGGHSSTGGGHGGSGGGHGR